MTHPIRARARSFAALALYCLATAWAPFVAAQQLSIADVSIVEGNSSTRLATFTVNLSAAQTVPVFFDVATANGTATAGSDYVAKSLTGQRITIGSTSKTFTVTINSDTTSEADEAFSVNLSNPVAATISDGQAIGTIINDDAALVPALSIGDAYLTEGDSGTKVMGFTIYLSAPATGPVNFDVSTSDGSALAGSDYVASTAARSIPAGSQILMYSVTINGDTDRESNEDFSVQLANVSGATVADGQGQGLIENDDFPPQLWVEDVVVDEGNSGTKSAVFTVTLSHPAISDVTFDVSTSDDSATAGSDYDATSLANQTIPAGQTTATFAVTVNGDSDYEPTEYFHFDVSNVSGDATISDINAVGAIVNDDVQLPPIVSVGNASLTEGDFGFKYLSFPVTLSYQPNQSLYLNFHTTSSGGSTTPDVDYYATGDSGMWLSGGTSFEIQVVVRSDFDLEADETLSLVLDGAEGATLGNATATGTIVNDDDGTGPAEISVADAEVLEGNSGNATMNFVVSLSHAAREDVRFNTSIGDVSADRNVDFDDLSPYDVLIPAGQTSVVVPMTVHGDTVPEADEFFALRIDSVSGAVLGDVAGLGKIIDDDTLNPVYLSIADVSISEGAAGAPYPNYATFTVSLSAPVENFVYFDVRTADITATSVENADYREIAYGQVYILPGQTSYTFSVPITGDDVLETDETFAVNLSNIRGARYDDTQAIGTITNDDAFKPAVTITGFTIVEGNDFTNPVPHFTVTLSQPTTQAVSFWASATNGTATGGGSDFYFPMTGFSIPAGETSVTIPVQMYPDTYPEGDESFTMELGPLYGAVCGTCTATGTILNDDGAIPPPSLGFDAMYMYEGNSGTQVYRLTAYLTYATDHPVTFNYVSADDTATAGEDYVATSGSVTIPAGATYAYFYVTVNGDTKIEGSEKINFLLSNIVGASYTGESPPALLILNDDYEYPTVSINNISVAESTNGQPSYATFTLSLSKSWANGVAVDVTTTGGSATAGVDFVSTTTRVDVPGGWTSWNFQVPIIDDAIVEPNESFTVTLSNPAASTIADGEGVATILDDDTPPALSVGDVSIAEGDAGTKTATFTVSLSKAAVSTVGFNVGTANGTATAGSDYVTLSLAGQQIAAGQTSKTFTVTINGDTTSEPDETFSLNLSNVSGASVSDGSAIGTITNDDAPSGPGLSIADVTIAEGNSGTKVATFTVTMPAAQTVPVFFDAATANGTATAGNDYVAKALTGQRIPVGSTSKTFTVTINGDTTAEPNETFLVNLSNPVGGVPISDGQAIGTISNDDAAATPTLSIGDVTISEGNTGTKTATFTVSLSAASANVVTYDIATSDGSAVAVSDYVAAALSGQSIPAGQTSKIFSVTVNGDIAVEHDESFGVYVSGVIGATVADGDAIGTITNDDMGALTVGSISIDEGNSGHKTANVIIGLSQASYSDVSFDVTLQNGTAEVGSDFDPPVTLRMVMPAGTSSLYYPVEVRGDTLYEANEDLFVTVSNPSGASIEPGQGQGRVVIVNDDAPGAPALSIGDISVAEGNDGLWLASYTVSLSAPAAGDVTFEFAMAPGTATAGSDYVASTAIRSIPAGQTSVQLDVAIRGDFEFEPDESFTINLSNPTGATIADGQGVVTILNDDSSTVPTLSISDATVVEGNNPNTGTLMAFTVNLSSPSAATVSFNVATANGTASVGSDFDAPAAVGLITAGSTSTSVQLLVKGDTVPEANETFFVNLSNPAFATIADGQALGTITNDDGGSGPTLSIGDVSISEGNSATKTATFTVTLSAAQTVPVFFDAATANGTATAGSDYVAKTLTGQRITVGTTSKTFTVVINGDTASEPDETFLVNISNPVGGGVTIADAQAVGTITNDDAAATPTLSIADVSIAEGNAGTQVATFTVSLSPAAAGTVSYDIATSNGTATAGSDYVAASLVGQSMTAGATSKTFSVTVNGDATVEPDETFTVNLSNVVGATVGDASATGTISNDDSSGGGGPTLSIADVSIAEGNSSTRLATFTVTLSAAQTVPVFFDAATANGTATAGSDYVAKALTGQRITVGSTSKTFTVTINGDTTAEPNETFTVNLSNPVGGVTIADGQAIGTITNDDAAALSAARFDAGGLVDDLDDGNRAPQVTKDEYALLLLDTATKLCERTKTATIVGIDGVENRNVLADLADTANATCTRKPRYQAVMGEQGGTGFLVEGTAATDARGVSVLEAPTLNANAGFTALSVQASGQERPLTVLLPTLSTQSTQRTTQLKALGQSVQATLKADPQARLLLIGGVTVAALSDLSLRDLPKTGQTLPAERILLSPALLREFGQSRVEFLPQAKAGTTTQVLQLQR